MITGDKHQNSVRNVPRELPGHRRAPPVATEFVGTSISSEGTPANPGTTFGGDTNNPHILFENFQRGYVRVQLDAEHWTNEFRVVDTVTAEQASASTLATWMVDHGKPGAYRPSAAV